MLTLNDGRSELWQWDTGRKLTVDAECSQVHFSNKVFGRSIDVNVIDSIAVIPDFLLQTDKELIVWAYVGSPENGYTKISKAFKINRRNKPSEYVFTPVDQMTMAEISAIAQSVRDDADAGLFNGKDGATFTPSVSSDGVISWTNDKELPNPEPVNIKGVKGDKGDKGDKGEPGEKGADGHTPVKGKDYFTPTEVQEIAEMAAEQVFVEPVIVTYDSETNIPSHTAEEIYDLYTQGARIYFDRDGYLCQLARCNATLAEFSTTWAFEDGTTGTISVVIDYGSVVLDKFTHEGSKSLRFTGAVSATYNGTKAVDVEIPTDDHINGLIDEKLGVIENGTY